MGEDGGREGKVCAPTSRASENPSSFHYCYCYVDERGTILPSPSLSSSTLSFPPFTSIFFSLPHPHHRAARRQIRQTNPVFPSSFGFALVLSSSLMSRLKFRLYFLLNLLFPNFYFIVIYIHVYYYSLASKLRKF